MNSSPRVTLAPEGVRPWIADAIHQGGAQIVPPADADVLVWAETAHPNELAALLDGDASAVKWVQLPWAGVEPYVDVIKTHADRTWTCAKGVYAGPVAEHAFMLLLAGLRGMGTYARASAWSGPQGTNLLGTPGRKLVVLGGGGITERLLPLLAPLGAEVVVVRRHQAPLPGATKVVGMDGLDGALDGAIGVILALALTPETTGVIGRRQLERMHPDGWIVNVARGSHIVTDELVAVLQERLERGERGGAALDVTDPEPLPERHPLWTMPNCLITPHVGNTPEMAVPLLTERIAQNIRRFAAGEPLLGLVDPILGY
jgi:phosphoglycerate dehydrogenase-like enzyme